MLAFIFCLLTIGLILLTEEIIWRKKILTGEYQRKFGHIALGIFAATWPWFLSWNQIKLLGLMAVLFTLSNYITKIFHYMGAVDRGGYGDIYYALSLLITPFLTHQKVFFAIAILHIGIADGLAAIFGVTFGRRFQYRIFGQLKTAIGTMAFWLSSLFILGFGLPFASSAIGFNAYVLLLFLLPPLLSLVENLAVFGLDNLFLPPVVILALSLAQSR